LTSVGLGGATAPILGDAVFDQGDGETPLSIDAFYVPSTTPYSGGWGGYAAAKFKTVYEAAWENSNDPAKGSGTWSFNVTTGELTVNGTGNLNVSPWMGMSAINPELYDNEHPGYWSKVLSFVVGEGITHIQTLGVGMQINCASVTLPSTLKYVGYSCLEECAFTSIELPEGLETIDDYTFFDSKLTSLTIPSTVTYIGSSAFLANADLATITCLPATPPDLGPYEPCFGDGSTITAIYVPAASVNAYKDWEWDGGIGYTGWGGWKDYAGKFSAIPGLTYDSGTTTYTFNRTGLTENAKSTICLPFSYDKPSGCTFYSFTGVSDSGGEWEATFTELSGTPAANTPYIFKSTGTSVEITKNTGGAVDYNDGIAKATVGDWTFQGTYSPIKWTGNPIGYYGFAGSTSGGIDAGTFVHLVSGASAAPFRAYLKCDNPAHALYKDRTRGGDVTPEGLPKTITVRLISAEGAPTAIGKLDTTTGELTFEEDAWFTLDGKHLTAKPSKKGVYINNGKKVIVK
jgi:hypothetical protein